MNKTDTFIDHVLENYLGTALWSSTDDTGKPLDNNYSVNDVAEDTAAVARADIESFLSNAGELIDGMDEFTVGHNFWLNRNGHGAGFWDLGLGERGDRLSEIAKTFGSVDLYVDDDGKVRAS